MDDNAYKAMTLENNKHIDMLAQSVESLASSVGGTNNKLEDLVDVINTHNVLSERVDNLHTNLEDYAKRMYERIEHIEQKQQDTGCPQLKIERENVNSLGRSVDANRERIKSLEEKNSKFISDTTIKWGYTGTVLSIIAFCSWLMLSNSDSHDVIIDRIHELDKLAAEKINMQRERNIHDDSRYEDTRKKVNKHMDACTVDKSEIRNRLTRIEAKQ